MTLKTMTISEFEKQKFSVKTEIVFENKIYKVLAVDFHECLIAIDEMGDGEPRWKRCEHCAIKTDVNIGLSGNTQEFLHKANEAMDRIKIEIEKKKKKDNEKAIIILAFLATFAILVGGLFFYSIIEHIATNSKTFIP